MNEDIVLFTHGIDIDGFGCAILAKLAFGPNVKVIFADNFDLDDKMYEFDEKDDFDLYDKIIIADHCPSYNFCQLIELSDWFERVKIFDHHASRLEEQGKMPWIDLKIQDEKGVKCCGTSLLYEYLLKEGYLTKSEELDRFVELTRLYDTWDWTKDKENGEQAYRLNVLFQAVGRKEYINTIGCKLFDGYFKFDDYDNAIIDNYLKAYKEKVADYVSKISTFKYKNNNVGFVEIEDLYKNDIASAVRAENSLNIDYLMMPVLDRNTVSLRNVNTDIDVSIVAKELGGGGHKAAASFPTEALKVVKAHSQDIEQ